MRGRVRGEALSRPLDARLVARQLRARVLRVVHCDEVVHALRTDPDFAAAVLHCVSSAGKDKLGDSINALPRLDT